MLQQTPKETERQEDAITPAQIRRERLRFSGFKFERRPSGTATAEVELDWIDGVRVRGRAEGQTSELGDIRIAAQAALRALEQFSGNAMHFDLLGVKLVRAFDATIVIVSVAVTQAGGPARLLGSYLAEEDQVRGAVLAVLNATNRMLGNFIATR